MASVLQDRMHSTLRRSQLTITRTPAFTRGKGSSPEECHYLLRWPCVPTVSSCWSRYMNHLGDNSLRFRLLLFKANFSKQSITYILNGGWNSIPVLRQRDKQEYCAGQKQQREELTVCSSYSTSELERTDERRSSHTEKQWNTQHWFLNTILWFRYSHKNIWMKIIIFKYRIALLTNLKSEWYHPSTRCRITLYELLVREP